MGRPRKNPDESRHGKHAKGNVRIAINLSAEQKAVMAYTAAIMGLTMKELLVGEGMKVAVSMGVVDELGKVLPEHEDGVSLTFDIMKDQNGD